MIAGMDISHAFLCVAVTLSDFATNFGHTSMSKTRLLRITTVPISLKLLLEGQLSYFQQQGFEVMAVSAEGPEVKDIIDSGVRHEIVPMTRKITPFKDLVTLFNIIRIIRKFSPDIVHTHTPKAGLLGMMAAFLCRVPHRLHTVAGLPLMESGGLKRYLLVATEKITYACATKVYPNSRGLYNYIVENFSTITPVKVIGRGSSNGIDTDFFKRDGSLINEAKRIRYDHGIGDDEIVFSFVGRIVKDKGIGELIAAFTSLLKSNERIRLLLIGPFERDLDPLSEADEAFLHNNRNVVLAGFQRDVRPWLMASDVFVFPSYREGFPNVVMQACCLEIPCIVSDINGCNEIIEHDVNGLIVPAKNVDRIRGAMLLLMTDKEKRISFAKKARQFVVANFDRRYVWEEIGKEYATTLNLKP